MKILVSTLIIASAAGAAMAQEPAAKAPVEATKAYVEAAQVYNLQARVVAELASAQGFGIQKNSPLQADEVNESVQTLADGNRIVRNSTTKFYRNSEGRVRREGKSAFGNAFGTTFSFGNGVSISNPVQGQKYVLDSDLKTARVIEMPAGQKSITIAGSKLGEAEIAEVRKAKELAATASKLNGELKVGVPLSIQTVPAIGAQGISVQGEPLLLSKAGGPKYETRTEELGTRDFEGVSAEGTRRTTIIPADAIGNERPIEIVYERWYSKEIGMVVYSKNTDPRSGEQTYKLTNIIRSEPDPSLFAVPTEYKKVSENGTIYRVSNSPVAPKVSVSARPSVVASPAKAGKP